MKKLIVLLMCLFLFTGCDITYNLDIDNEIFSENVSVLEKNENNWDYIFVNQTMYEFNDYYLTKEIPYHYDDPYVPEDYKKINNVSYYNVSDLSNDSQLGLSLKSKQDGYKSFAKSNMVWSGVSDKYIKKKNGKLEITVSKFKVFDQYRIVDNLTINIKSKYYVLKNNADSVNGDVYTWNINRDNYNSKVMSIIIEVDKPLIGEREIPYLFIIIGIGVLCLIIFIVRRIKDSGNDFD